MTMIMILFLTLTNLINFSLGNSPEWREYFANTSQDTNFSLSSAGSFSEFMQKARLAYPTSPLFKDDVGSTFDLAKQVIIFSTSDKMKDIGGLAYAQHACKYLDLGLSQEDQENLRVALIRPRQVVMEQLNTSRTVLEVLLNAGTKVTDLGYFHFRPFEQASDELTRWITNELKFLELPRFTWKSECFARSTKNEALTVRNMGVLLGDGAIDSEVDLTGASIEGQDALIAIHAFIFFTAWGILDKNIFDDIIDRSQIETLLGRLAKAYFLGNHLKSLRGDKDYMIKHEAFVIQALRELPIGEELLFPFGFTDHAMLMSIHKTDKRSFEILVFNSGAGISQYHTSVILGDSLKYSPATRYSGVTLSELKLTGFFLKMAEFLGIGCYGFENENDLPNNSDALYGWVHSCLGNYFNPFGEAEIRLLGLILSQRSGCCAMRAILAYFAYHQKGDFRPFKLCLFREVLHFAWEKTWSPEDFPIMARIVKFAIENYARSLLRHYKKLGRDEAVLRFFWHLPLPMLYEKVQKFLSRETFPIKFAPDLANCKQASSEPVEKLFEEGRSVQKWFSQFEVSTDPFKFNTSPQCKDLNSIVFDQSSPFSNLKKIDSLLKLLDTCWSGVSETDKLAFLSSTILYQWPDPSIKPYPYQDLFPSDNPAELEANMRRLFNVVIKLIEFWKIDKKFHRAAYSALVKIGAIYHAALLSICPGISAIKLDEYNRYKDSFTNPDTSATSICKQMSSAFFVEESGFYSNGYQDYISEKDPFFAYLREYIPLVKWTGSLTMTERVNRLLKDRLHEKVPPHHYFWRAVKLLLNRLHENQLVLLSSTFDPMHETQEFRLINKVWLQNVDSTMISEKNRFDTCKSRCQSAEAGNRPLKEMIETLGLTEQEFGIHQICLNSKKPKLDLIQVFPRLLAEFSLKSMDWATILYLGLHSIRQVEFLCFREKKLHKVLERTYEISGEALSKAFKAFSAGSSGLRVTGKVNEKLLRATRRASALLILKANLACAIGKSGELSHDRIILANIVDSRQINGSYGSYLLLAYILSIQSEDIKMEEALKVLEYNIKLEEFRDLLKSVEKNWYTFQVKVIVSRALFVLARDISNCHENLEHVVPGYETSDIEKCLLPFFSTRSDYIIDLLSGHVYAQGHRVNGGIEQADAIVSKLKVHRVEFYDFEHVRQDLRGTERMLYVKLKYEKMLKLKTRDSLIMADSFQILSFDSYSFLMFNFGPVQAFYIPASKIDNVSLQLPSYLDPSSKYSTLYFPDREEIVVFNEVDTFWISSDHYSSISNALYDLKTLDLSDRLLPLSPLCNPGDISYFKSKKSSQFALLHREYGDLYGKPLWFTQSLGHSEKRWNYLNNQKHYICESQRIAPNIGFLKKFLVLENQKGNEKFIMIPVEHFEMKSLDEVSKQAVSEKQHPCLVSYASRTSNRRKKCLLLSLNSKQEIISQSRFESLLLAYHYLISRQYWISFKWLSKVHQMERFTLEELRLFGWILLSNSANKDGSPDSFAVRAMAVYMVYKNSMLFSHLKVSKKHDMLVRPLPYDSGETYASLWAQQIFGVGKIPCLDPEEFHANSTVEDYFRRISKIPSYLRFHHNSGRNFMSSEEESMWLSNFNGPSISLHLNRPYQKPTPETSKDFASIYLNWSSCSNFEENLELPKSFLSAQSDGLENFGASFSNIVFKKLPDEILLTYEGFLRGLLSGKAAKQAKLLLKALRMPQEKQVSYVMKACKSRDLSNKQQKEFCDRKFDSLLNAIQQIKIKDTSRPVNDTGQYDILKIKLKNMKRTNAGHHRIDVPNINESDLGFRFGLNHLKTLLKNNPDDFLNSIKDPTFFKIPDSENFTKAQNIFGQGVNDVDSALKFLKGIYSGIVKDLEEQIFNKINDFQLKNNDFMESIRLIGKGRREIDRTDLFHLYAHSDYAYYQRLFPDIPNDKCEEICGLLARFILALSTKKDIKRLLDAWVNRDKDKLNYKVELENRMRWSSTKDTVIMAYELFIDSRLTEQQYLDVDLILREIDGWFRDLLIERIMSGGKSFIYGTLLAFLKANLKQLSILVVPKELHVKESSNLINRTMNAFNNSGFSFTLEREGRDDLSHQSLLFLAEAVENAKNSGQYIILTPETLLVLQLKFIEAFKNESRDYEPLRRVLEIFEKYGTVNLDEVHVLFNPRHGTHFPLAGKENVEEREELANQCLMLNEVFLTLLEPDIRRLSDVRVNVEIQPKIWKRIKSLLLRRLASKLVHGDFKLPIKLGNTSGKILIGNDYRTYRLLCSFFSVNPEDLKSSDFKEIRDGVDEKTFRLLVACRMAVQVWIYNAWDSNVNQNYGLSDDTIYAIPFNTTDRPKIGSEYSLRWNAYIKTIRTYLVKGFNQKTAKEALRWLQKWAFEEMERQKSGISRPEILFKKLFQETPHSVDIDSSTALKKYLSKMVELHGLEVPSEDYLQFMCMFLSNNVLLSIQYFAEQLSAESQDIPIMFKSATAYTGTATSVRTLPPCFLNPDNVRLDPSVAISIRNKIEKQAVLNQLTPIVIKSGLAAKEIFEDKRLKKVMKKLGSRSFNALIDIGGYFRNQKNEEIAKDLQTIQDNVLYFSSKPEIRNKLVFLSETGDEITIHVQSKEVIKSIAGDSKERVTFYDEANTTGVDIFQSDDGYAIAIIGPKTTRRDFDQGVLRMRKLLKKQLVIILIPDTVQFAIQEVMPGRFIDVPCLFDYLMIKQQELIKKLNFMSLTQMVTAVYKKAIYEIILKKGTSETITKEQREKYSRMWITQSDAALESMVMEMDQIELDRYIEKYLDGLDSKISGLVAEPEKVRLKAENLVKLAFGSDYKENYEEKVIGKAVFDELDSEQIMENETENQNLNENDNDLDLDIVNEAFQPEHYLGQENLDWESPEFNPDICALSDIRGLKSYFSKQLYICPNAGKPRTLFGADRNFTNFVLVLEKGDDLRLIIVDAFDISEILNVMISQKNIFGYEAILLDPVLKLEVAKTPNNTTTCSSRLLVEYLIFGGCLGILEEEEWIEPFREWVSVDVDGRSAFFIDIVLSQAESDHLRAASPLRTILNLSEENLCNQMTRHEYVLNYFYCGKLENLEQYAKELIESGLDQDKYGKLLDVISSLFSSNREKKLKKIVNPLLDYVATLFPSPPRWFMTDENLELLTPLFERLSFMYPASFLSLMIRILPLLPDIPAPFKEILENVMKCFERRNMHLELVERFYEELNEAEIWARDPEFFSAVFFPERIEESRDFGRLVLSMLEKMKTTHRDLLNALVLKVFKVHRLNGFSRVAEQICELVQDDPSGPLKDEIFITVANNLIRAQNLLQFHGIRFGSRLVTDHVWFDKAELYKNVFTILRENSERFEQVLQSTISRCRDDKVKSNLASLKGTEETFREMIKQVYLIEI